MHTYTYFDIGLYAYVLGLWKLMIN